MTPRIAVLRDFPDEGWPSMDLCADELLRRLPNAVDVCPSFVRFAGRLPGFGASQAAKNADRLVNRFAVYGGRAASVRGRFDAYHIADHSYAHLVHHLPAHRTGVYCHDIDAFRCLVGEASPKRPRWFRSMAERIRSGLDKAAVVFHSTQAVRREIEACGLVDPGKLVQAPLGVSPVFCETPDRSVRLEWLDGIGGDPWILHVGSCIPRKRIDVLLDAFAAARREIPQVKLVKVGGEWTDDQRRQIEASSLNDSIVHRRWARQDELAELYRRAPLVVVPSEAEGFGLPVVEALACGAPVAVSDIPSLRESAGLAGIFVPVGDVAAWSDAMVRSLTDPSSVPDRNTRRQWAQKFSWSQHAQIIHDAYVRLATASGRKIPTVGAAT